MRKAVYALFLAGVARAVPQITLPFNAQIPPVAQVSWPYSYQFSASTFSVSDGTLEYSIQGGPGWLNLDNSSRTLWGNPTSADVGTPQFSIIASDESGSTTMPVSLVVVDSSAIQVTSDIASQLGQDEVLLDSDSVALYTGADFSIVFNSTTFTGGQNLNYYAVSSDRSPLPSWVTFNAEALAFSGTAPTQIEIPQTFGICLLASEVPNFSESSLCFSFVVNEHQLAFKPFEQSVNISRGSPVSFTLLKSQLSFDGSPVTGDVLVGADASVPQWLNFNASTLILSGEPPPSAVSQSVKVRASDRYGDNAHSILNFYFESMLFQSEIGVLNATIGTYFSYTFNADIFTTEIRDVQGQVPSDATPASYNVSIKASSQEAPTTETQNFQIQLVPMQENGQISPSGGSSAVSSSKKAEIAAAVLGSILGVAIIGVAVWYAFLKTRRQRNLDAKLSEEKADDRADGVSPVHEKQTQTVATNHQPSADELYLAYPSPPKHMRHRSRPDRHLPHSLMAGSRVADDNEFHNELNEEGLRVRGSANRSSTGIDVTNTSSLLSSLHTPRDRRSGFHSRAWPSTSVNRRSYASYLSFGLPFHKRMSGLGHGRPVNGYGSPGSSSGRKRPRDSVGSQLSNSYNTLRDSFPMFSEGSRRSSRLSMYARDKRRGSRGWKGESVDDKRRTYLRAWYDAAHPPSFKRQKRMTIRKVDEGEEGAEILEDDSKMKKIDSQTSADTRPLEERRQSWVKRRASSANVSRPLFSARDDASHKSSVTQSSKWRQASSASINRPRRPLFHRWSESSDLIASSPKQYPRVIREPGQIPSASSLWEDISSSQDAFEFDPEAERGEEMLLEESMWEDVPDPESPTHGGLGEHRDPYEFGPEALAPPDTIGVALGTPTFREQSMEEELAAETHDKMLQDPGESSAEWKEEAGQQQQEEEELAPVEASAAFI